MNINLLIDDVVERIARGETVRVKLAFKNEIIDQHKDKYPDEQIIIVSQDDNYVFFKQKEITNE